ncbi:hypothetical protein NOF55_23015 [Rhizobiaceae bacterium BDR2-2]|uniref:Uncharacterized protein n=1 Tax=Ectorhizobium quercum TaxID=2965071 RepID=A0AAE3SX08_9HYPH|nr:hypothetical protein [Ectorhizobium quercum]MCX8999980.1 hypothetical protein [Ectorhizobium quercum]
MKSDDGAAKSRGRGKKMADEEGREEKRVYDRYDLTPEEARQDHRDMLRFLAINVLFGMGLGILIAGSLLWFDIGGLWTHVVRSRHPVVSALLLFVPLSLTFGSVVVGSAIMTMPYKRKKEL